MTLALNVMEIGLPSGTAHALLALAVSADPDTHEVTMTAARLAELTGSGVRVTRDRLGALRRDEFLTVLGRSRYRVEIPKGAESARYGNGKGAESARYGSKGAESARYENAKGAESAPFSRARALPNAPSIEGDRETRAHEGNTNQTQGDAERLAELRGAMKRRAAEDDSPLPHQDASAHDRNVARYDDQLGAILKLWSPVCGRIAHNGHDMNAIKAALTEYGPEIVKDAIGRIAAWYEKNGNRNPSHRRARTSWISDRCVDIQNEREAIRVEAEAQRGAAVRDIERFAEPPEMSEMERARARRELDQAVGEMSVGSGVQA